MQTTVCKGTSLAAAFAVVGLVVVITSDRFLLLNARTSICLCLLVFCLFCLLNFLCFCWFGWLVYVVVFFCCCCFVVVVAFVVFYCCCLPK